MLTSLLSAPITPAIEQTIGQAGLMPVTVADAAQHLRTDTKYMHKPELLDMDLSPWVCCRITGALIRGGRAREYTVELDDGDLLTLPPDAILYTPARAASLAPLGARP